MSAAAVETVDLRKSYPNVEALRGLSLRIEPGEIFALLGPNGAGKTTWISIVCGLVRPSGGTATVLGHDVVRDSLRARRQVGLVPQEVNFDPFFTPREVLRFQMGYYCWRAKLKGMWVWHYCDSRNNQLFPYGTKSSALAYPTARGPIATLRSQWVREGIDDLRYLKTLEAYVEDQKGYQTNRHELEPEIEAEIRRRWAGYFERYGYE